jgi:hypothetical protein
MPTARSELAVVSPAKLHGLTGPSRVAGEGQRRRPTIPADPATIDADAGAEPGLSERALAIAIAYADAVRRARRRGYATDDDLRYARTRLRRIADRIDLRSGTINAKEAMLGWAEDVAAGRVLED